MGILLDPISVMMLVVISTVSLMVHIYSFGYMKGETLPALLRLPVALHDGMLGLVVATNIFQMYVFWELVGVSSYLLIGFYYTKPEAIAASKKPSSSPASPISGFSSASSSTALLCRAHSPSPDRTTAGRRRNNDPTGPWTYVHRRSGQSAMFPLHIWLPDAMEGPTPCQR